MPKLSALIGWRLPAIALLLMTALAGCTNFDTQQRRWIFQASAIEGSGDAHIDGLDDVWIQCPATTGSGIGTSRTEAAKLHALWIDGPSPRSPVMLYLHGARRNVESSAFRIEHMQQLGFAVLAIDYRGFGRSTDELPSEATVDEDARAGWAWLQTHQPGRDRYIFGHSLGGAIAVRLATEVTDAKGLIVEGTFTSIPAVFQTMKWGWLPVTPFITQRFDSADRIANVKVPVLVVHGDSDSLIRPELGRALYERASSPKRFVLVEGGTHYSTNSLGREQYRDALRELFGMGA
jgi:alpha-beta hydrolase superfamily lysophospholipase